MKKTLVIFLFVALLILLLTACSKKATPTISEPPHTPPTPTQFTQSLPIQGSEEATPESGLAHPTESPLPTPVSPLPTPTPSPTS